MTSDEACQGPPAIPPDWYVASFNREPMAAGQPFRGPLDPLVMMAWHFATSPPPVSPIPIVIL